MVTTPTLNISAERRSPAGLMASPFACPTQTQEALVQLPPSLLADIGFHAGFDAGVSANTTNNVSAAASSAANSRAANSRAGGDSTGGGAITAVMWTSTTDVHGALDEPGQKLSGPVLSFTLFRCANHAIVWPRDHAIV
jgi:hypothetical protein